MQPASVATPAAARQFLARAAAAVLLVALCAVAVLFATREQRPPPALWQPAEAASAQPGADRATYIARLQSHLQRQPHDARGWVLLARSQLEAGDSAGAAAAYARALALPKVARDPQVLTEAADAMAQQQGGRLAGAPADLIHQALGIDGRHPRALEMAGGLALEERRYDDALQYWGTLQQLLPADDPRAPALDDAMRRVALMRDMPGLAR